MSKAQSLVNKLKRRKKYMERNKGFRTLDKIDKKDEILANSPSAYKLMVKIQRQQNNSFGQELQPNNSKISKESLMIADLSAGTGLINCNMPNGDWARASEVQPNDYVKILSGALIGKELKVLTVDYGTGLLELEDDAAVITETVSVKIQISGVKKSYV